MDSKWMNRFMDMAELVATWSKDPSTKVGAVAVDDDHRILAVGYNGFPRGVDDTENRLCDRPTKYSLTTHAEANLVAAAARTGTSLENATLVVSSLYPCSNCAGMIVQAGIRRVIAPEIANERWMDSNRMAQIIFDEANVEVTEL